MSTLSLVIVAKNEERTIGDVLAAAAPIADEIIFVDSGSDDRTIEIAKSFDVKVFHQEWLGYAAQKNFALGLASGDWLLSLDADEVMTPHLVSEVQAVVAGSSAQCPDGFRIPRILFIGDQAVTHGGFYPDAQLRLFRRGKGQFRERLVHEAVFVDGPVGRLRHPMRHLAYKDAGEFEQAMEKYARLSAQEFLKDSSRGWRSHWLNEWLHPGWTFFYRYVIRRGFLDGALGLRLNLIYSDYVRRKIRYLRQALKA